MLGNFTNDEVTAMHVAIAGIAPRATHDAFSETFDATDLARDYAVALTPLEAFVRERVDESRATSPR